MKKQPFKKSKNNKNEMLYSPNLNHYTPYFDEEEAQEKRDEQIETQ